MENNYSFCFFPKKLWLSFLLVVFFSQASPAYPDEAKSVSLKTYPNLAVVVPNPMDLTQLPAGKSYQVNHPDFILQFFLNGNSIYGVIFKRKKDISIYIHWCFFRSCEDSPYDYKLRIADAFIPPYDQDFFTGNIPSQMKYQFQGLEFFSFK
jgi:hypothetical protein